MVYKIMQVWPLPFHQPSDVCSPSPSLGSRHPGFPSVPQATSLTHRLWHTLFPPAITFQLKSYLIRAISSDLPGWVSFLRFTHS